jgi:hypothetical protein
VVEHKGAPYFTNDYSKERRLDWDPWADRSAGKGVLFMIENEEFGRIDQMIRR